MAVLYLGLITLGLVDCLAPLLAHQIAGGPIPPARDLAQLPLMVAFALSALAYRIRPQQLAVKRLLATAVATLTAGALGHVVSAYYLNHAVPAWGWLADASDLVLQQLLLAGWVALLAVPARVRSSQRGDQELIDGCCSDVGLCARPATEPVVLIEQLATRSSSSTLLAAITARRHAPVMITLGTTGA